MKKNLNPPLSDTEAAARKIRVTHDGLVRCRVCGCTEIEPCCPPCSWVEVDLCSGCLEAIDAMYTWFYGGHRPSLAALLREYKFQVNDTPVPYKLTKKVARGNA